MQPSSLTLFILAPERIALTSRLGGEGIGGDTSGVGRDHVLPELHVLKR